jgi:hypothetical protein
VHTDFDNFENRALANNSAAFILTARRNNPGGIAPIELNMQKEWVLVAHLMANERRVDKDISLSQRHRQISAIPRRVRGGQDRTASRARKDRVSGLFHAVIAVLNHLGVHLNDSVFFRRLQTMAKRIPRLQIHHL